MKKVFILIATCFVAPSVFAANVVADVYDSKAISIIEKNACTIYHHVFLQPNINLAQKALIDITENKLSVDVEKYNNRIKVRSMRTPKPSGLDTDLATLLKDRPC